MYCINCGAPINDGLKCEYCGTTYTSDILEHRDGFHYTMRLGEEEINVYLSRVDFVEFESGIHVGRDESGRFKPVHKKLNTKRKFTFIEC